MGKQDDAVGYGRPPRHTQFQKGHSGNPRGRRKQSRNVKTILRQALNAMIRAREGDKVRSLPTLEALLLKQLEKALKGDQRAWSKIMELTMRYPELAEEPPEATATAEDDERILERHRERLLRHQGLAQAASGQGSSQSDDAGNDKIPKPVVETPPSNPKKKA